MDDKLDDLAIHLDAISTDCQAQKWIKHQQQMILNSLAKIKEEMIEHKQAWEKMVKAKDTIFETMMTIKITLVTHQEQVVKDQQDNK